MSKDEKNLDSKPEFLVRLFGDADELEAEELDVLFEVAAPGVNAVEEVQKVAQAAAAQLRERGEKLPAHLESALKATKQTPFENLGITALRKIVKDLQTPVSDSVDDPVFAYRNLKEDEVTEKDEEILEGLAEELKEDWDDDETTS